MGSHWDVGVLLKAVSCVEKMTTILLIRHAEKPTDGLEGVNEQGANHPGSQIPHGWQRAEHWQRFVQIAGRTDSPPPLSLACRQRKDSAPSDCRQQEHPTPRDRFAPCGETHEDAHHDSRE